MNAINYIVLFVGVFISVTASASPPSCKETPQNAILGTTCFTSGENGVLFERVWDAQSNELGWKDTVAGLIWFDAYAAHVNFVQAESFCSGKKGQRLPSSWPSSLNGKYGFSTESSEFVIAARHGIQDVIKDSDTYGFWSGTSDPSDANSIFNYQLYSGTITSIAPFKPEGHGWASRDFARCVSSSN